MAPTSLLNIISVALLSIISLSLPAATNAVSLQSERVVRSHNDIARSVRKRRSNSSRCKATSSLKATTTKATTTKTTTTKKAAATKVAVSSSVSLRGKACLAWPNGGDNNLPSFKGSTVGLIYSWDPNKPPGVDELGLTYAPMLWGWNQVSEFQEKVVEGYAKIVLGCNEPNELGQSNMDAWSGIALWRQYILPLADKGYTLISPAMSSRPNGKDWMKTFMENCGDDCAVGGVATHYYGTDFSEFKTYVEYWHTTYNLPVYVTEYADQDFNGGPQASMDEIWAFMTAATEFANANSWLHAHCWFGAMVGMSNVNPLNTLMNSAGNGPNDLGYYFINN